MPTGYTAAVGDGTTTNARDFILSCARAMGACIMQRDEPMSAPPKMTEPSDYHAKALAVAEADLLTYQQMNEEEAGRRADAEHIRRVKENTKYRAQKRDQRNRYQSMLYDIKKWEPPTSEHRGLKEFMQKQLSESIDFDCSESYLTKPEHRTGTQWLEDKRAKASHDIGYHRAEYAKEVEQTNERNAWIQALYDSVKDLA